MLFVGCERFVYDLCTIVIIIMHIMPIMPIIMHMVLILCILLCLLLWFDDYYFDRIMLSMPVIMIILWS